MLRRSRTLTLVLAGPLSLFAYHPLHALASPGGATCDGMAATKVVTSHSPHSVNGTSHRDVIVMRASGHVVHARGGNDIICGSSGHDTIFGGHGQDTILGEDGNDDINGGAGNDDEQGNGGDDTLDG